MSARYRDRRSKSKFGGTKLLAARKSIKRRATRATATFLMSVAVFAVAILPNLSQIAQAVSISSISESQGPTTGQNKIIIKGEGFLRDQGETVKEIVGDEQNSYYALVLTSSGRVLSWGQNNYGQLGTGDTDNRSTPTDITSKFNGTVVKLIAGSWYNYGNFHASAFALTSTGKLYAWGYNAFGQLGTGDTDNQSTPQDITSNFDGTVTRLIANGWSTFALTDSGKIYSWGCSSYGQLGDGTLYGLNKTAPQDITSNFNGTVTQLAASGWSVYALTSTHHVYAWGRNYDSQIGTGDDHNDQPTPVDLTDKFDDTVVKLFSASGHELQEQRSNGSSAFALTAAGRIYGWGSMGG